MADMPQGSLVNPIQNPLTQMQGQGLFDAQAQQRAKLLGLMQTLQRANVLKEQPGQGFSQGRGAGGVRMGEGPMGYMTSIGDAIAAVIAKARQKKAMEDVIAASGLSSEADQRLAEHLARTAPGGLFGEGQLSRPSFVAQGSPLGGMSDPLALNMKY